MKTKQWKKAAALMSAGAMTASIFAAPLAVKADDKVTISFSFDQGVGEATQKMVDALQRKPGQSGSTDCHSPAGCKHSSR